MFRRLLSSLVVLSTALVLSSVVAGPASAAGACTATPNPAVVGSSYTVAATGLTVNTAFVVRLQQSGVPVQELFSTSDPDGNAATGGYYPGPVATAPGTVSITWKKLLVWPQGGGEIITYGGSEANCSQTIVA